MTTDRGVSDSDAALTELLGPKCPACGWRGGQHRPAGQWFPACLTGETETTR